MKPELSTIFVTIIVTKLKLHTNSLNNGTMQNRFLDLDNFFIFLAYDDLKVGISDGDKTQARARNVVVNHLELIRDKLKILFGAENSGLKGSVVIVSKNL